MMEPTPSSDANGVDKVTLAINWQYIANTN